MTTDWESFRQWYPGIKEGRLVVTNTSAEPVTVSLTGQPGSSSGCWYAPAWADAPAFPSNGLTLSAGQTSTAHTIGAYTSGSDGLCATSGDDPWRGYLVVKPVSHPADQILVRLRLNSDSTMSVDVTNQAGGTTTAAVSLVTVKGSAFGQWTLKVATPAAPTPVTAPSLAAARVTTAAMTSGPPVFRFDVTGAALTLPGSYANQMTVPPLVVQGSRNNGATWTPLGSIVPSIAPTITPQNNGTAVMQLGPSTFWWENAAGSPAYTQLRVGFGTTGPQSAAVTLSSLPAPTDGPSSGAGPQVSAPNGVAALVDTGIDQSPLSVQVLDANSNPLPLTDPHYARIYYRQVASNALVTGLLPAGGTADFIGLTPYAGAAYANNGTADSGAPGQFQGYHYVGTTSTQDQKIIGYVSYGDTAPAFTEDIEIHATAINPVAQGSTVAGGLSLAGCSDFTAAGCRLASATTSAAGALTPAMYADVSSGQLLAGVLTTLQATTAISALPLPHDPGAAARLLASATLNVSAGSADFGPSAPPFASGDQVDTTLVTHGALVPLTALTGR
jgi:hypothetical protein